MGERAESVRIGMVVRAVSGNFLEMFDFFLMGIYATDIARTFFPLGNEYASMMLTFGTFGAAFLIRPVGALVLGPYIDRVGRRQGLTVTLAIMGMGTVLVAFVPGYATIGLAAPILVFMGRILQGFSTGVELSGVAVYLAEIAPPNRRGLYTAWQPASQQVAITVAALLGYLLTSILAPSQMNAWGWRLPFFFGCLIIPCVFVIRRSLRESDAFLAQREHPTIGEIYRSVAAHWAMVLAGMLLVVMTTVSFYMITVYTPTFAKSVIKLTASDSLLITICIALSNLVWLPVMGALSDRIGRAAILVVMLVLMVVTAYPVLHWLVSRPSFDHMLIVELWFSFLYGSYNGVMVAALAEFMPKSVRTSSFALAYSLATTAGGFTAAISTMLIHTFNDKAAPGYWLSFAAVCGLVATHMIYGRGQHWLARGSNTSPSKI